MYKVLFTMNRQVTISDDKGKKLQGDFNANLLPRVISIDGSSFLSADIKGIEPIDAGSTKKKDQFTDHNAFVDREYNQYRGELLKQTPATRGKRMHIAKIIWFAMTGRDEMPQDVMDEVIERQIAYFKQNPKCIHPDPMCFKEVMDQYRTPGGHYKEGEMRPIVDPLRLAGMRFVEQVIRTDKQMAAHS